MPEASNTALMTFAIYTLAVFLLAVLANRASKGKEFVRRGFVSIATDCCRM